MPNSQDTALPIAGLPQTDDVQLTDQLEMQRGDAGYHMTVEQLKSAIGGGGMMVQKQQIFTASGTFTPSPGLIAQGGHCHVLLVGGGGRGGDYEAQGSYSGERGEGGYGGEVVERVIEGIVTPQQVIIGAGGNDSYGNGGYGVGGNSLFGALVAVGGAAQSGYAGNKRTESMPERIGGYSISVSNGSNKVSALLRAAGPGRNGYGAGGRVGVGAPPANSGCGGSAASSSHHRYGASGICIVTWWEAIQ